MKMSSSLDAYPWGHFTGGMDELGVGIFLRRMLRFRVKCELSCANRLRPNI